MGFLFGFPKKLLKRITEIEIDTHYYDNDVVPSNQDIFTYIVDTNKEVATITGFSKSGITSAVMSYRVKYGFDTSEQWYTVSYVKDGAFKSESNLISMTLPNTLHTIPKSCFANCGNLSQVNIPKSINVIETKAFENCSNLDTLFIGTNVKEIANDAFNGCSKLSIICYKDSIAEKYAIENNINYSLLSYKLDNDITENSKNLVTSGTIYSKFVNVTNDLTLKMTSMFNQVNNKLTNHINNKLNPHDDSTFTNATLEGTTSINTGLLNEIYSTNDSELIAVKKKELAIKYPNYEDTSTEDYTAYTNELTEYTNNIDKYVNETNGLALVNRNYVDSFVKPDEGAGYQTIIDNKLETNAKTVISAINEINSRSHYVRTNLKQGWNNVSLNYLYPIGWKFTSKPYAYTSTGESVDYTIINTIVSKETIKNESNTFDIFVPVDCILDFSTTVSNEISGYPMQYLVLTYYYTGTDGKDLDTVTGIENNNWPLNKTVGYGHKSSITNNDIALIQFGGDNLGGGTENSSVKYYESVYFDINEIENTLPGEDIEVVLYGTWYSSVGNGNITISLDCYTCDEKPTINIDSNTKRITLSGNNLVNTYSNATDMYCYIPTLKGGPSNYKTAYTPAFKIKFHRTEDTIYNTVTIQQLS